jgi:hypothetical protein
MPRQYFPKGANLSRHNPDDLAAVAAALNGRPRKALGWKIPPLPDEIEVAYLALRHTLLGGYVLRSRDRAGAEQELWALLTVYQVIRMAMTAATGSVPGTDPDRASFTAALETARDQVAAARILVPPPDRPAARSRTRRNGPSASPPHERGPDTRRGKIT